MDLFLTALKVTIEGAGFLCGVMAVCLLMFAALGLVIYGRDPLTPRLAVGGVIFGAVFLLLAGARVLLG